MLELAAFSCVDPGGRTIGDLSLTAAPGSITAVVGRSGSGGATLVRALAGAMNNGRIRGTATLNGRRIDGATRDELTTAALWISDDALPGGTVADCLRILTGDTSAADDLGLADDLARRLTSLPIDLRLRLHCASLLPRAGTTAPSLILVDRVLGAADAATRDRFCTLLRDRARDGATVLWAEHDLDAVWEHAEIIVELVDGRIAWQGRPDEWQPHSLPEPTLLTLARALDVPPADCRTAEQTLETLEESGIVLPLFPRRTADSAAPTGSGTLVDAATVGLSGTAIEIRPGECVGIIDTGGRPEALARRLISKLPGGDVVPSQLPGTLRIGAAARTWERRHDLPVGSVLAHLPTLRPRALLVDLSPGELALFRLALAGGPTTPLWLSHPQAGLDPRERHSLAEDLRRRPAGTRLVTSRDVEFLVRACHRLVVVSHDHVIGDGSPSAVAKLLPTEPLVCRAVGSTRYLRLTDVLATTETQVHA
ncbi:ATP-binding cassette domain-containing protein [Tessaracoccus antarcticus]|uniref:ATP-binding cassette domain-containing protein n=1 Tax=Tessaracoccus antarcticus TaxID=2479848 RepID=A0A3M0G7I5_9ACTN|nr:ATP-binding cassette domain-containing protein [Tessaracoccus antarcticus]RMB58342.1 ATP-binding cassette domain-containing protein [Tessaracoccus antarcticus]